MRPISPLHRCLGLRAVNIPAAVFVTLAAAALGESAVAESAASLPIFSACKPATPPVLPLRWHAVALLFPLTRVQLDVGEFVYDGALPAMRATLYGLESGAADLLITDHETYQLIGPREQPSACIALGPKYRPPARQWLSSKAVCEGEASVGPKKAQWWKMPAGEGRTQRQWYASDTRLPWRVMFPDRAPEPAVFGDYAVSYFPRFSALTQTKLAALRDFCRANAQKPSAAAAAARTARDLMALGHDISAAERTKRVQALIPGLSHKACAGSAAPLWPHNFVMTGILTPVQFKWTPLPSLLFYDWDKSETLYAYMHEARAHPPAVEIVSVLKNVVGYSVERLPNGKYACGAKGPGVVRPDWMRVAGCECKAVLDHNPHFGPDEVSEIRACPIKNQGLYPMWSWYTRKGRPILFTEPRANSTGLHIADYDRWLPGAAMPPAAFDLPRLCTHAHEAGLPPVGSGLSAAGAASCIACHVSRH
jgi:hypothetical protein